MLIMIDHLKFDSPTVLINMIQSILVTHLWNGLESQQYAAEWDSFIINSNLNAFWKRQIFPIWQLFWAYLQLFFQ